MKQFIANEIKDTQAVDLVLRDSANSNQLFEQCKQEITKQDAWKNISITNYLPKFAAFLHG